MSKTLTLLHGGLMRGAYQGGASYALEHLEKTGVEIGDILGVSVGVCNGEFLHTRSMKTAFQVWLNQVHGSQLIQWTRKGPRMDTRHLLRAFARHLPRHELGRHGKFFCVLTDLETGTPVYWEITARTRIWRVVVGSIAIPPIVKPVEIGGRLYADGGISDPLPIEWAIAQGYTQITVILTRPLTERENPFWCALGSRFVLRGFPHAQRALAQGPHRLNASLDILERGMDGVQIRVVAPKQARVHPLCRDPVKLRAWFWEGYRDMYRIFRKSLP